MPSVIAAHFGSATVDCGVHGQRSPTSSSELVLRSRRVRVVSERYFK